MLHRIAGKQRISLLKVFRFIIAQPDPVLPVVGVLAAFPQSA